MLLHDRLTGNFPLILDGGLGSELERRGHDIDHHLWSARLLIDNPAALREIHESFATAGADIITTATYQASFQGFAREGIDESEAGKLFVQAVDLARVSPGVFVAASMGPYGACLADGSEYRGDYGLTLIELKDFHRPRLEILAGSSTDLIAFETIPSAPEALALAELLREFPGKNAWISFSCRDPYHISDGTPWKEITAELDRFDQLIAVGFNCVPPSWATELAGALRNLTRQPVIAYPNSGENYDAAQKSWTGTSDPVDFARAATEWRQAGCQIIGGCCRTGPEHIRALKSALTGNLD